MPKSTHPDIRTIRDIPTYPAVVTIRDVTAFRFETYALNTTFRTAPAPPVAFVLKRGRAYAVGSNVNVAWPRSILVSATQITVNADIAAPSLRLHPQKDAEDNGAAVESPDKGVMTGAKDAKIRQKNDAQVARSIETFADLLIALNKPDTHSGAIRWLATQPTLAALLFDKRAPLALIPKRAPVREGGWKSYLFELTDGCVYCNGARILPGRIENARLVLTPENTVVGGRGEKDDQRGPIFVHAGGWRQTLCVTLRASHSVLAKERWDDTGGAIDALKDCANKRSVSVSTMQATWGLNIKAHTLPGLAGYKHPEIKDKREEIAEDQSEFPALLYHAMVKNGNLFPRGIGYVGALGALLEAIGISGREKAIAAYNHKLGYTIAQATQAKTRRPITPGVPFAPPTVNKDARKPRKVSGIGALFGDGGTVFVQNKEDGWRATVHVYGTSPSYEKTVADFELFYAAHVGRPQRGGSIVVVGGDGAILGEYPFYPNVHPASWRPAHWREGWIDNDSVRVQFSLPPIDNTAHIDIYTKPAAFDKGKNTKKLDSKAWQQFMMRAKTAFVKAAPCVVDCELVAYDNGRTRADAVAPSNAQLRVFDCYVLRSQDITNEPYWSRRNALLHIAETATVHVPTPDITKVRTEKEAKTVVGAALAECRQNKIEGVIVRAGESAMDVTLTTSKILCFKPAWDTVRWPLKATMRFLGWGVRGKVAYFGVLGDRYDNGHPWHSFIPVAATTFTNIDGVARNTMIDTPEAAGQIDPTHNCYMATTAPSLYVVTCERILPYRSPKAIKKWAPAVVYMQRIRVKATSSRQPTTIAEFARLEAMACNP